MNFYFFYDFMRSYLLSFLWRMNGVLMITHLLIFKYFINVDSRIRDEIYQVFYDNNISLFIDFFF